MRVSNNSRCYASVLNVGIGLSFENSFVDSSFAGVRHSTSNSRIVVAGMSPIRCNPAAVSWRAAKASLRYFFLAMPYFTMPAMLI